MSRGKGKAFQEEGTSTFRGVDAQEHTPGLREAPPTPLVHVGEEFRTGPEMKRGLGHIINGFRNYVKGSIISGDTAQAHKGDVFNCL